MPEIMEQFRSSNRKLERLHNLQNCFQNVEKLNANYAVKPQIFKFSLKSIFYTLNKFLLFVGHIQITDFAQYFIFK